MQGLAELSAWGIREVEAAKLRHVTVSFEQMGGQGSLGKAGSCTNFQGRFDVAGCWTSEPLAIVKLVAKQKLNFYARQFRQLLVADRPKPPCSCT